MTKDGAEAAAGWAGDAIRELKLFIKEVEAGVDNQDHLEEATRLLEFAEDDANHED